MTVSAHALLLLLTTFFAGASPAGAGSGPAAVEQPRFERGCSRYSSMGRAAALDRRFLSSSAAAACGLQPWFHTVLRGGYDKEAPGHDDEMEAGAKRL
jgi:hypothetical protein